MKKIFALILVLSTLFTLTACQNRTPLTIDAFTEIMEQNDYTAKNVTAYINTNGVDCTVLLARDKNIKIWFYVFEETKEAKNTMANIEYQCDNMDGNKISSTINLGNFSKYSCSVNDELYIGSRIDNTVVLIETTDDQKGVANDILEALGYK